MNDRPIRYHLKVYDRIPQNGGRVLRKRTTKSIRRFQNPLRLFRSGEVAYLLVRYGGGGHNDGYFTTKKTLLSALRASTEK